MSMNAIIRKTRVYNPSRYLYALEPNENFYIAVQLTNEDYPHLETYGLMKDSPARIPIPTRSATRQNADGKWKVRRDLPKEPRYFTHTYHVIDWHGTSHSGVCCQERMCYPRELIPPTELAFTIEGDVLYSPLLTNTTECFDRVQIAMNVVLEMLGRCEIWTAERAPALTPIKQVEVPWEILRAGTRVRDEWEQYIKKSVERKSESQQVVIRQRHKQLWQMQPDFCVLGTQNFWGYVVYGFTSHNLYVFECNEVNNATYVFKGDWASASHLTKTEVLAGNMHEARVFHTENWLDNLRKLLTVSRKEGM